MSAAAEAWSLMYRLFVSQRSRFLAVAAELELAPAQLGALKSLEPGTPMPMSKLAGVLGCDNSNVTGIVDRLEARGLVERRSSEHDRRVKMLVVTERGAELRERLVERMGEPPAELAALPAAEQRTLRDVMRRALNE
jgi:MarR family transcriptional regulator, organic hydroperoxide resistance regulator